MRPDRTGKYYALVLVLSVGLVVLFAAPMWGDGDGGFVVYPFMFVVAGYSIRQLLRPIPRVSRIRDSSTDADKAEKPT